MDQHCFFIAVRHPLARAESPKTPQLPLGEETPGNTKPWGNQIQGQRQRPTFKGEVEDKTNTTPNLQGCGRDTNNNNNDRGERSSGQNENKDNSEPPRVRSNRAHQYPQHKQQQKRQIRCPTSKNESNEAGFSSRIYFLFFQKTNHP